MSCQARMNQMGHTPQQVNSMNRQIHQRMMNQRSQHPKQKRIYEYTADAVGNMMKSARFVWGLFIPSLLIACLINPYFWKLFMDGKIDFSIRSLIISSIIFAVVVSFISSIPAYFIKFNYDDIDCYPEHSGWEFWNWPIFPWNWGKQDESCVERRKKFGNIASVVGIIFISLYIIYKYYNENKSLALKF